MMRQFSELTNLTVATYQVIPASPERKRLFIQHLESSYPISIYRPEGDYLKDGIRVYPKGWIQLDRDDDCHKEWWVIWRDLSGVGGLSVNVQVIEFFPDPDGRTVSPPTEEPRPTPPRVETI